MSLQKSKYMLEIKSAPGSIVNVDVINGEIDPYNLQGTAYPLISQKVSIKKFRRSFLWVRKILNFNSSCNILYIPWDYYAVEMASR